MNSAKKRVIGISGSLRKDSFNTMALKLAASKLPAHVEMDILDWRSVPPFDADLLAEGFPSGVASIRNRIAGADGILIVTPEYNFSVPGMLKNLLDWVSRGADQPLARKPVAILSASAGPLGGARVQYDLRKVLLFMNAMVLAKPEVFIGNAAAKFTADGQCTDEDTGRFVHLQMQAFATWIDEVARMSAPA
ncbi:NADPH-dependent FMN reductase [Variovorax sp. YR216]|uniref:NADPH-dependent FMN reductase n=1 Tax=Variovorax sp. YR216 TaxID=1882828 RepID=UPI00089BBE17|nr:NAD(P)H-dependent oxidoreductase [Variovorax sp. YR216]SEB23632.1 chromate reductase [Variovorax sp. YR216]